MPWLTGAPATGLASKYNWTFDNKEGEALRGQQWVEGVEGQSGARACLGETWNGFRQLPVARINPTGDAPITHTRRS